MAYNCPVCNNTNYEEIDGLFVCTECQTQSQEFIVQETEAGTITNFRYKLKSTEAKKGLSRRKPRVNFGRPWTIYEAYQIIILAQADSLIKQGASEDLKDVVFTIWANYLSKIGVAFCGKEKLVPDIVTKTKYGRIRELYRGTLNNPLNRARRPMSVRLHPVPPEDENPRHLGEERLYKDAKPDSDDDIVFLDIFCDGVEFDKNLALRNYEARRRQAIKSPEWMNMGKTLVMCYIGLMFTNPNILPCDVIRFVYESKVPYLSVTHLLPPDMVLSGTDATLFRTGTFDTNSLITELDLVLNYLGLNKLPCPNLDVLIPRFVKELCLSGEFASFALNLWDRIPFLWRRRMYKYKKQEVLAMGYIVLAVKLALRLDDTTEIRLSRYSKKLQNLLGLEMQLFDWTDWIKVMMQKRANTFDAYRELTKDITTNKVQHLDLLLECYYKNEFDKKKYTTHLTVNRHKHEALAYQAGFRESLRKPLETALERCESSADSKRDVVSKYQEAWTTTSQQLHLSTISHVVDISLFKRQVGEMSPKIEAKLDKLFARYSLPRTDIVQYSLVKRGDNLESCRHESYLCMLSLASEVVDCTAMELDKIIVYLQNYLIGETNGTLKERMVCTQNGHYVASQRSLQNMLKSTRHF